MTTRGSKAIDARLEGTEEIANSVDRLQQIVRNFRDRREGLVPGGCPLLNTAVDSDDGNAQLRKQARRALDKWLDRLATITAKAKSAAKSVAGVDPTKLATLIVSTLEGSLMLGRLQRTDEPLDVTCRYLDDYLETEVRAPKSTTRPGKS